MSHLQTKPQHMEKTHPQQCPTPSTRNIYKKKWVWLLLERKSHYQIYRNCLLKTNIKRKRKKKNLNLEGKGREEEEPNPTHFQNHYKQREWKGRSEWARCYLIHQKSFKIRWQTSPKNLSKEIHHAPKKNQRIPRFWTSNSKQNLLIILSATNQNPEQEMGQTSPTQIPN